MNVVKTKTQSPINKGIRKTIKVSWIVFVFFLVIGVLSALFTGGVALGFLASQVQDEPLRDYGTMDRALHSYKSTGEAYFGTGEFIGYLQTSVASQPISFDEISPHVIDALLAVEDNEFYEHQGIDFSGLSRAVLEYIESPDSGSGGSTITQQLVKNQFLGTEREFERKFKEMLLAMRVERHFDKNEILESYLNIIYLGYNANGKNIEGIQAAAKGIFDVDALDLNIPQSAYIAGMIHSPGRYTPFNRNGSISDVRLERGKDRMRYVLDRMLETGRITAAEMDEALRYDLRASLAKPTAKITEKYPYLTSEIESQSINILANHNMELEGLDPNSVSIEERNGYRDQARQQLLLDGYKVYTTLDRQLYEGFHEVVRDDELFGPRSSNEFFTAIDPETGEEVEKGYLEQTAATLLNNETGAILAMVEGRDFEESQVNFALNSPRQPGSSIKPLLAYGPAIDTGVLQPASVIDDAPVFSYNKGTPARNYANRYYGLVTVREALIRSHNATAYKAFSKMEPEVLYDYVQKLGLNHVEEKEMSYNSAPLGGLTQGLTVLENTAAYSSFANHGVYKEPYFIERIETMEGEIIYGHQTPPVRVFSEQTAFLITDMLSDVVTDSAATGRYVARGLTREDMNIDVAGKTGTTNDQYDYWFVGYTPQVSMGVWFGYERNDSLSSGYSPRTQNIWVQLMKKVVEIRPEYADETLKFEKPDQIVQKTVCSKSGLLPSDLCQQMGYLVEDYFNEQYVPTREGDRVVRARVIAVDGSRYMASPSAPEDFVKEGIYVLREPLEIPETLQHERYKYIPADWGQSVLGVSNPMIENGKIPATLSEVRVTAQADSVSLDWYRLSESDIVGYRLYRAKRGEDYQHIASISNDSDLTYVDQGITDQHDYVYYVTGVDIIGQESAPSSTKVQDQKFGERPVEEEPAPGTEPGTEPGEPTPGTDPEPEEPDPGEPGGPKPSDESEPDQGLGNLIQR